ncbi:hypothetical protein [Methylobacterium fujisawaense]
MNDVVPHLRRQPPRKLHLLFLIIWMAVALGLWALINTLAGRLVWWW